MLKPGKKPGLAVRLAIIVAAGATAMLADTLYSVTEVPLNTIGGVNDQDVVSGSYDGLAAEWSLSTLTTTYIPTPDGSQNGGFASVISNSGQIAGEYQLANVGSVPFFYDPNTGQSTNISVPTALQSQFYAINAINSSGELVGENSAGSSFSGTQSGGLTLLAQSATASGINDSGTIVGSQTVCDPPDSQNCEVVATMYPGGTPAAFGFTSGFNAGAGSSTAFLAINNQGQIIGNAAECGAAFLCTPYAIQYDPTNSSWLYAAAGDGTDGTGFFPYADYPGDYPTVPNEVYAGGINNSGDVVGNSSIGYGGSIDTFLYSGGEVTSLNSLVSSDWNIEFAYSINDGGAILAYGNDSDQGNPYSGYVLLEPSNSTPEPGTWMLLALALPLCRLLRRRRSAGQR